MSETERLYNLLPTIYRQRDAAQGEPLRALMAVIESELRAIEADIDGLYDNWFIETCDEWVVPYIADLLGIRDLSEEKQIIFSQRARVANTISYRRRKGTIATLERVIRDATGWYARGVEFFELLAATQHLHHVRLGKGNTLDLRNAQALEALGGPFESAPHTVDVRRIASNRGKHNIPNMGLFLWRLQSYAVTRSPAHAIAEPADGRYTFHPIGYDAPLFNRPQTETEIIHAAKEINFPGPIRHSAFDLDLKEYKERYKDTAPEHRPLDSKYYGPNRSLNIIKDGCPVPPMEVVCWDLSNWVLPAPEDGCLSKEDAPGDGRLSETEDGCLSWSVAVDVRMGRLAFAEGVEPTSVEVSYNYEFSGDIGGGPYDRHQTLADPRLATLYITVAKGSDTDTLQKTLEHWNEHCSTQDKPRGIIRITDNGIYGGNVEIDLPEDKESWLVIEAADGVRPCARLVGNMNIVAPSKGVAALTLNGLLIEGRIEVEGNLEMTITHCTLAPGRMLSVDGATAYPDWDVLASMVGLGNLELTITHSIVGPLRLPADCKHLTIQDSIVDAPVVEGEPRPAIAANDDGDYGPPTTLQRTTIFGPVFVQELTLASEVIFTASVDVQRQHIGCVRYSFVPDGSQTPRRFRCQPDLEITTQIEDATPEQRDAIRAEILNWLVPTFTSTQYSHAAYGQLHLTCPKQILTGAEDGSEMGAFNHLKQSQREDNLRAILDEYLPFGFEVGIFYVT